jgi:hypothetical protein
MGDYHNSLGDVFYEQAAKEIYDWLPVEKKVKLGNELSSEGVLDITDLDIEERFFRLLNFLELNYIKPIEWTKEAVETLNKIDSEKLVKTGIFDEKSKIIELEPNINLNKLFKELSTIRLREDFTLTLEKTQVIAAYLAYSKNKEKGLKPYE